MIDPVRLGPMLRERRRKNGWSLRKAADEIGVAFNTIARVEAGHLPDLDNYRRLSTWLSGGEPAAEPDEGTIAAIATHLETDPALAPDDAERIARIVRDMYEVLARPRAASAVHLRSATTFKPLAGKMLGELLDDMRARLEADAAS
jgi:transcriptional regulator with XRE-family HTH domain